MDGQWLWPLAVPVSAAIFPIIKEQVSRCPGLVLLLALHCVPMPTCSIRYVFQTPSKGLGREPQGSPPPPETHKFPPNPAAIFYLSLHRGEMRGRG